MYKVVKLFTDLKDNSYKYEVGDTYPREGLKVSDERLKELSGSNNRQGTPLIKLIEDAKPQETTPEAAPPVVEEEVKPVRKTKKSKKNEG